MLFFVQETRKTQKISAIGRSKVQKKRFLVFRAKNFFKILYMNTFCLKLIPLLIIAQTALAANTNDDTLLDYSNETPQRTTQSQDYEPENKDFVIVEPLGIQTEQKSGRYELLPYRERRNKWGSSFGVGFGLYSPVNYEPDQGVLSFEEQYGDSHTLVSFQYTYKRNFDSMALGVDLSIGTMSSSSSDIATDESSININIFKVGMSLELDTIMQEPLVVPYITGGGYVVQLTETFTTGSSTLTGNTTIAPYYTIGVKVQLDWIEKDVARNAYEESGVENTFFFVDARQFIRSSAEVDKYFDTDPFLTAGFSIEL